MAETKSTTVSLGKVIIRRAEPKDCEAIAGLIKELATFEKEPEEAKLTPEQIKEDGFGKNPAFIAFVAEVDGKTPAFALCFFAYSTWKGRCLYLEDLYVQPAYRRLGLGMKLIRRCAKEAVDLKCVRLMWQVLKWNTAARDFYKKIGAEELQEWLPCRFDSKGLERFLAATAGTDAATES